jgi:putative ABC transport system permease protein
MDILLQDLRFAIRMLIKRPGFTTVVVLALALGIGANSAIFTVVNTILLQPLPYEDPERLMLLWGSQPQIGHEAASFPDFVDWRAQNESFEQLAAYTTASFNLTGSGEPERVTGGRTTAELFSILRVQPVVGRSFVADEMRPGSGHVAMVSYGMWQRRWGGDPQAVGTSIELNAEAYTVVGILPKNFRSPSDIDVWTPLAIDVNQTGRRADFLLVIGRLKPEITLPQAQSEMTAIAARLEQQYPNTNAGWTIALVPLHEQLVKKIRPTLLVLLGAVGFVLLIACANVANLLLARAGSREKEIAIRDALGAGRIRLVRQLLTESLVLALIGGICGLILAQWGLDLLLSLNPPDIPKVGKIGIDTRVFLFTLGVSFLTGLGFGIVPALQLSRTDLNQSLKEGGRGTAGVSRRKARSILMVSEVALTLVLLVGAALMMESFVRLLKVDPGFRPDHLLTMRLSLPPSKYKENAKTAGFYQQLMERTGALPGVLSAAIANSLPVAGGGPMWSFNVEGEPPPPPDVVVDANVRIVSPNYFGTLGIGLVRGRLLTERDGPDSPLVIVINETMARRYWPDQDPIGKRIAFDGTAQQQYWREIVGITADVKHEGLDANELTAVYVPFAQRPNASMILIARTSVEPASLAAAVRNEVLSLDRDQPVYQIRTMDDVISTSVAQPRFSMLLLGIFASGAMILAAIGLYGVMSYSVTERTKELGVRLALGARKQDVLRLVVGQGMLLVGLGLAAGLAGAFALTRLMTGLLYGISATDPLTFAIIPVFLAMVGLAACYIPARRATKVDPLTALRYE